MATTSLTIRLPVDDFRSHPIPFLNANGTKPKIGSCYVPVSSLPPELKDWLAVNPRVPSVKRGKETLKGPVAGAIVETLMERPEMMCLMNNGITMLVERAEHIKAPGGRGELTLKFSDPEQHGIPNGGHTLSAIFQTGEDSDRPDPWPAMVRLHIYEGLESSVIPAMAEGLNRSLQVDDKSLQNLRGLFGKIQEALADKQGSDQIAYKQGDPHPVDVQFILTIMSMLNLSEFPDRKKHPNVNFGQPQKVLNSFVTDQGIDGPKVYDILLPALHEILSLTDEIQRKGVKELPTLKVKAAAGRNTGRVASAVHKKRKATFAGGYIDGFFPVGWLYPIISAFRANISKKDWDNGKFAWIRDPIEVLDATIEEMCLVIKQQHTDNNEKPAEVGRKVAAYQLCYSTVALEIAG